MKKIITVLGVMALLALAGISMDVVNAKPGGQELVVDTRVTLVVPGNSSTLNKGEVEYAESVLFKEGACELSCPSVDGDEVIGMFRANLMATEPIGTFGAIGTLVYSLPEGDIHVSIQSVEGVVTGVIIGGTGDFRGAAGEYSSIRLRPRDRQATFKFNFTVGKVSRETNGVDDWDFHIVATDAAAAASTPLTSFGTTMSWYGEITTEVTVDFDFGTILPGDVDKPISLVNGGSKAFFNSYPTSNGNYQIQVKSSATWGTLNFGTDITALKVDDDNVIDGDTLTVSTTYQAIPGHTSDPGTGESGATVPLYGWISLAAEGLEVGSYTGTLFISILAD